MRMEAKPGYLIILSLGINNLVAHGTKHNKVDSYIFSHILHIRGFASYYMEGCMFNYSS